VGNVLLNYVLQQYSVALVGYIYPLSNDRAYEVLHGCCIAHYSNGVESSVDVPFRKKALL
jgi:hypothetical protein